MTEVTAPERAAYQAAYYQANKGARAERNREHHARWMAEHPTYYADYAKARRAKARALIEAAKVAPCMDCGVQYPTFVMDLDHVRGEKVANLGNMKNHTLTAVREEIAKCDAVCSNCHRIRTHERANG